MEHYPKEKYIKIIDYVQICLPCYGRGIEIQTQRCQQVIDTDENYLIHLK